MSRGAPQHTGVQIEMTLPWYFTIEKFSGALTRLRGGVVGYLGSKVVGVQGGELLCKRRFIKAARALVLSAPRKQA